MLLAEMDENTDSDIRRMQLEVELLAVGDEAVCAKLQATSLMMKNLCKSRNKIHRDGEREFAFIR